MQTIGLILAYDGTPFVGWQKQAGNISIQGCLEDILARMHGGQPVPVRAASRTDAGVHAEWQGAAFDTCRDYPPERWSAALNAQMPPQIIIRHAFIAPPGFHPRFQSQGKHYRYLIWQGHSLPPMLLNRAMASRPLDVDNMHAAAQYLLGTHDFSAFRAIDCQAKSSTRTLTRIDVTLAPLVYAAPCSPKDDALIQIDVFGTAFLKQMVRIIAGTLLTFGLGRPPAHMASILESKSRTQAGETAPACGLTLVQAFVPIEI